MRNLESSLLLFLPGLSCGDAETALLGGAALGISRKCLPPICRRHWEALPEPACAFSDWLQEHAVRILRSDTDDREESFN